MILYNVTFDLTDTRTELKPYIPKTTGPGEDNHIPRVCLTNSVEHCFQAMSSAHYSPERGSEFLLRTIQVPWSNPKLIKPEALKEKGLVPDALENHEYWLLQPMEFEVKHCRIIDFRREYELAWSCITSRQCFDIIRGYRKIRHGNILKSSEEIYLEFNKWAEAQEKWDMMDQVYEELADLPWAQITRFYDLEYEIL